MKPELVSENSKLNKEIIQWCCKELLFLGYKIKNNLPEKVLNTPWSYVIRFETSQGSIYLKHTPEQIALEATIIRLLHDEFHARVPIIIAHNPQLNCFLMRDAGQSLRAILKRQFDADLFCKGVLQFTSLQLATADHVDAFLNIGVPDWRLHRLPGLYKDLLSQKDTLIEDGLSETEINELAMLLPKVSHLCKNLSDYSIKQTLVQPDFNDNNMLLDEGSQDITMIDLGEIVISHPFFSLLNCLQQIKKHYGFTEGDSIYLQIRDACLKNYINFHSKQHLLDALKLAEVVQLVYGMLAQHRLMLACGKENIMLFQPGRLSNSMKEFLRVSKEISKLY